MPFGIKCFVLFLSYGLCWAVDNNDRIVVGKTFMAGSTDPRKGSTPWALTSHGIAEKLFTVDQNGDTVGQVAESVSKVDGAGKVWIVTLKSGYKFSDGTEVDAQHVADCLNELNKENSSAQSSLGSMTVTAPYAEKKLVLMIESERPTHVMDAVLAEWVFVVYYIDGYGDFVYTGPYIVKNFVEGDHIDLAPNEYYARAKDRPMIQVKKYSDGHALAKDFENDEVDVGFHLPIDTLSGLRSMDGIHVRSFEVGYHYMVFHNIRESHMSDIRVRKAIDLAIDRTALSQALAGGRATRSLFPDYTVYFTDDSDPHGNKGEAEALLDAAGWTLVNGTRTKDGEELIVDLVAYPHRPGLVIMQPVIEQQLTALGITVRPLLTGDDWSETQTIINNADFDLLMWAQHTLPAGDPAWFLNSFFRTNGANNHAGYSSVVVDSKLDTLAVTEEHQARVSAAQGVHDEILADVPVSNLVTPAWHVGLSDRVVDDYKPWGSDYYVIRADTFIPALESTEDSSTKANALLASSLLVLLSTMSML